MKIYIKAGDREYITNPNYEYTLRDGHIIQFRPDKEEIGKAIGYSTVVIQVPVDFWDVRGTRNWNSLNQKVLDLKKYISAAHQGKYLWEAGYIDPSDVSTKFNKVRTRRCDWFVDFKWMLDQGWIDQKTYNSIYNFGEKTPPINLERDFTQFMFHEDQRSRLVTAKKNMAWTTGNKNVAAADGDYTTWKAAIDDMGTLTGDASITGLKDEEISDDNCLIDNNLAGFTLTLKASSGVKHNGGAYGNGHRIAFGASDQIKVDEVNAGEIDDVIIQDLAIQFGTNASYVNLHDGGDSGHIIVQRCVLKGGTNSYWGIDFYGYLANAIIRNNSIYDIISIYTAATGIRTRQNYIGNTYEIYNNTICKCEQGIDTTLALNSLIVKNNLCQGNTTADYANTGNIDVSSKNVSEDATSPDDGIYDNLNCHDGNSCFTDYANNDYRLTSGGDELSILDDGDDLSAIGAPAQFSDDIEDQTRSTWYIGASEYVAGGQTHALAGAIAGASSLSAIFICMRALIGPIAAISTASGSLRAMRSLVGALTGSTSVTGGLRAIRAMAGAIASVSGISGGLRIIRSLAGSVASVSSLTARLLCKRALAGAIAATSTITGTITIIGQIVLKGAIAATSAATGSLRAIRSLAGAIAASSSVTGGLRILRSLAGTISATSAVTGAIGLAGKILLAGTIAATSAATGSLRAIRSLAGAIAASSSVTGGLRILRSLAGAIAAISSVTGRLATEIIVAALRRIFIKDTQRREFTLDTKRREFVKDTERRNFTIK